MTTPENRVKAQVTALLKKHGVWYFKPVSNGMGQHGISDVICCVPPTGRMLAIECKGHDLGKPTTLQQVQLDRIQAVGGSTFLATPSTIAKLENLLQVMSR